MVCFFCFFLFSHLDKESDGTTLVHFQDLAILGPNQDVAVAERYGTYGGVVLQQKPCRGNDIYNKVLKQNRNT